MKVGVNLKIDVTKIDKSKLFNGAKGTYLDAQVFIEIDQADQYGNNGMITQAVSQEERQQGAKGAILGNCKVFWNDQSQQQQAPQQAPQQQGGFAPQQAPQQQGGFTPQQQAATPRPPVDFSEDIPF